MASWFVSAFVATFEQCSAACPSKTFVAMQTPKQKKGWSSLLIKSVQTSWSRFWRFSCFILPEPLPWNRCDKSRNASFSVFGLPISSTYSIYKKRVVRWRDECPHDILECLVCILWALETPLTIRFSHGESRVGTCRLRICPSGLPGSCPRWSMSVRRFDLYVCYQQSRPIHKHQNSIIKTCRALPSSCSSQYILLPLRLELRQLIHDWLTAPVRPRRQISEYGEINKTD